MSTLQQTSARPQRHLTAGRRWRLAVCALVALATVAGVGRYVHHLGYPSGTLYTEVPARRVASPNRDTVAIFFSGDMGFKAGMGIKIARRIAAQGIPVLGFNSLAAFSSKRTPAETSALVAAAAERALAWSHAHNLLLIGQSFGADALIGGATDLPPAIRTRVAMIALVVPQDTISYRATPGGVLSFNTDGPSLPLARKLDWAPVLCVHGETERDSLCTAWQQANVSRVALPGGHFLNLDTALVATTIIHAMPRPATPS